MVGGGGLYWTPNRRLGPSFGLIMMTMMMMSVFAAHNWVIGLLLLFGFGDDDDDDDVRLCSA